MRAGVEMARDKFNAEGGIIGRQVQLLIEDGANDPAQSVSATEKVVTRDKVDLMIAAWGSSPTLAVSASVTKKYGVPHVVDTASSVKVTKLDGKRPTRGSSGSARPARWKRRDSRSSWSPKWASPRWPA